MNKTYGKLRFMGDHWLLTELAPHVAIKFKAIFTKVPKKKALSYVINDMPDLASDLLWFESRYPLEISPEDRGILAMKSEEYTQQIAEIGKIVVPNYIAKECPLIKPARPYQNIAVEFWRKVKRFLLADDVGLGKTVSSLAMLTDPECLPAAVVVQSHLPDQWVEEVEEFMGKGVRVHVIKGRAVYDLPEADIYIYKYTNILGWRPFLEGHKGFFKTAIFDEIQELRNSHTEKWYACKELSEGAEYVVGLSATPVYNKGSEMFTIMNIIKPDCLGDYEDFSREWVSWDGWVEDPKALGAYLQDNHLVLRRTKADVGQNEDNLDTVIHNVDIDKKVIEAFKTEAKQLAMKVLDNWSSFHEKGQAARELDNMVRQYTGIAKAPGVCEFVKVLLQAGEPIMLCAWHRAVYDIYAKELAEFNPVFYTGEETLKEKNESKRKFIEGETKLFIISLRSGAGLDGLQFVCNKQVLGELDWSPKVHYQLGGRLDRYGQESRVTQIFCIANAGSDPVLVDLLGLKKSQSDGIMDPFSSANTTEAQIGRGKALAQAMLRS